MEHNLLNGKTPLLKSSSRGFWNPITWSLLALMVLLLTFSGGIVVWAQQYEDRLPPRSFIAGMDVSGLRPDDVHQVLQRRVDALLNTGVPISLNDSSATLSLATDLLEDVYFDLDAATDPLMALHRDRLVSDALAMFRANFTDHVEVIPVELQTLRLQTSVLEVFPDAETLVDPASFEIARAGSVWSINVQDGQAGSVFDWKHFFEQLEAELQTLSPSAIALSMDTVEPVRFSPADRVDLVDAAQKVLNRPPITLSHDGTEWTLTADVVSQLIAPTSEREIVFVDEPLQEWLNTIAADINVPARDARIEIENGRVVDFVESREGVTLDEIQLRSDLERMLFDDSTLIEPIALLTSITAPEVKTSDVNDLGIDQVLGVGTSSYAGSPWNRRRNIQNGVDLLNGLLIAPGDTFSLNKALSPYTEENGYLPELVIKGDSIEPEIGGGLCQIGTTTFRATMNSGLPVTERRNHSLTVSYYNDPSNGNPGTDATIYDPAPDYKFTNDTEHYVLFQAENLTNTQQLRFTFWGTSDGRTGSYTPPVVHRWIPVGETVYTETLELEPGVEECQEAHVGADASFTYTIARPDGLVEDVLFESHYRPLPEICLVGVEELTDASEDVTSSEEDSVSEDASTTADASDDSVAGDLISEETETGDSLSTE